MKSPEPTSKINAAVNPTAASAPRSFWVWLGNSAGFWMILFAAFGMLSLSFGEKRIQKRMLKQQMKTAIPFSQNLVNSIEGDGKPTPSEQLSKRFTASAGIRPKDLPPYRLTGLRWALTTIIVVGACTLGYEAISRRAKPHTAE